MTITDHYDTLKLLRQQRGAEQRLAAEDDFLDAASLASLGYMKLVKHKDGSAMSLAATHYTLRHKSAGWLLEIYGNRRLYRPANREPRAPMLDLPDDWTLIDVVYAAVKATEVAP